MIHMETNKFLCTFQDSECSNGYVCFIYIFGETLKGRCVKICNPNQPMVIYGYSQSHGEMGSYEVNFQMCGGGWRPWPAVVARRGLLLAKARFGGMLWSLGLFKEMM